MSSTRDVGIGDKAAARGGERNKPANGRCSGRGAVWIRSANASGPACTEWAGHHDGTARGSMQVGVRDCAHTPSKTL
eukprot:547751-Rhodomonas_salina.1